MKCCEYGPRSVFSAQFEKQDLGRIRGGIRWIIEISSQTNADRLGFKPINLKTLSRMTKNFKHLKMS
jgi:hypothetical protein